MVNSAYYRLYDGGADPQLGQPNATDTARQFKHEAIISLLSTPRESRLPEAER